MPKRQRNCEKHSMFGHLLLNLGGGGIDIHAIWKGVSGQARVHGGGGARGRCPPPYKFEKKMLSEEILTLFTYVLLMKLGGNRYTVQAKWKGGRTDACP